MNNIAELIQLRGTMRQKFAEVKKNPMDMNNLMSHIATMSQAIELLMAQQISSSHIFEAHMEMLQQVPEYEHRRGAQVANIEPWRALGQVIKAGKQIDLSLVPSSKLFFWSDQHYGHNNIIKFSNRPFGDLDQMHSTLLEYYKQEIGPDDIVVWIGDVSFKGVTETNEWLDQFPGYKILVVGNHDLDRGKLKMMNFDEIHTSILFDNNIVTHHPWHNMLPDGFHNIHGHTHNIPCSYPRHYCACVEMTDYRPIPLYKLMRHNLVIDQE